MKNMDLTDEEVQLIEQKRSAANGGPLVHVWLVLDRSGSMATIRDDVVGGINSFLADQRKDPSPCVFTLVQFDNQGYEVLREAEPLTSVKDLQPGEFQPRGATPLYDAIGRAIRDADAWQATHPEAKVLLVTMTDGLENASTEFTRDQVAQLTEQHKQRGWTFAYLGANQDAYAVGAGIGVAKGSSMNYLATPAGVRAGGQSLSYAASNFRSAVAAGGEVDPDEFWGERKP